MNAFTYNEAYAPSNQRRSFKTIDCVLLPTKKNPANKYLNEIASNRKGLYIEDEWKCNKSFGVFLKEGKYYSFMDVVFGLFQYYNERLKCGYNEWLQIEELNQIFGVWLKGGVITKADVIETINQKIGGVDTENS